MQVSNHIARVTLETIGEGADGMAEEGEVPLLRFDVDRLVDGKWEAVDDASYCTQLPDDLSTHKKLLAAQFLLREVTPGLVAGVRIKKLCERLSWIVPSWFLPSEEV